MQNWSKLKDRAQRVDKKNEFSRLVMFTPRVMVKKIEICFLNMSKMTDFMYILLDTAKYQFQFGQYIYVHL